MADLFKPTDSFTMDTFNTKLGGALAEVISTGIITMWSGAVNAIPAGWALCNGENGTPDLRGRFVVGAGNSDYAVGATGGTATETLTAFLNGDTYPAQYVHTSATHDNRPPFYALCYIMKV